MTMKRMILSVSLLFGGSLPAGAADARAPTPPYLVVILADDLGYGDLGCCGFRVPLIARWPGRFPSGRVSHQPAITMDVFATALAAAGVAPPGDRVIDGKDLLPLLSGSDQPAHEVDFGNQGERLATVRDGRWKLHVLPARAPRDLPSGGRWVDPPRTGWRDAAGPL
jgi:arylsulfatase A-like enzyme